MASTFQQRLQLLSHPAHRKLLGQGLRGIERETLRVNPDARLALTPHPVALGSTLTHPNITTDYSESLMEFITSANHDIADSLNELEDIHRHSVQHMGKEMLWSQSMPSILPDEASIPIAWYGHSHIGMIKHVYRRGLAVRYGKSMQCIAGIHYNFSFAEPIWELLREQAGSQESPKNFQSESYIALIRNFLRTNWLLMFLFGASPAVSRCFLKGREHGLQNLSENTLYLPYATSLRMSDLGYQNNAQNGLVPPYNTLLDYMRGLSRAVRQPYPPYAEIGTQKDGEWIQINTNILQIENEFYASIRPKRVIRSGERPLEALCDRGVQYVEVRCLDVNPYQPLGIDLTTSRFMDVYLTWCALSDSPLTNEAQGEENNHNFALAVKRGREPGLQLQRAGKAISLRDWGLELLDELHAVAALLDQNAGHQEHQDALQTQIAKLNDYSLTPSAQVLADLDHYDKSFIQFGLAQTERHDAWFKAKHASPEAVTKFIALAQQSLAEQAQMEEEQQGDFDQFILAYAARNSAQLCSDQ